MKYAQLIKAIDSASKQLLGRAAAAVNQSLVIRNWIVGAYLVEFEQHGKDRATYGVRLLEKLASDLKARCVEGLGISVLERSRRFYLLYPEFRAAIPQSMAVDFSSRNATRRPIPYTPTTELPLASVKLPGIPCPQPGESAFKIRRPRKGQRLIGQFSLRPVKALSPQALPQYTESELEKALLDHLQKFLLELGAGFLFEARQRRITAGNEHDYVDLVFSHRHLAVTFYSISKIRPFRHGDAGQMNFYLNWWKQNVTTPGEQPPVGIILCSDKDHTKVEFATAGVDNQLFVSRYLTALPSAAQLQRFVETDRDRLEAAMEQHSRPKIKPAPPGRTRKKTKFPHRG